MFSIVWRRITRSPPKYRMKLLVNVRDVRFLTNKNSTSVGRTGMRKDSDMFATYHSERYS